MIGLDVKAVSDFFDMEGGKFSLVQGNYLMCLNSIGGMSGKLAVALFMQIIQSANAPGQTEDSIRKGSHWSYPMTLNDIISCCEGGHKNEESMIKSYRKSLKFLLDSHIFHQFGKNNFYCYTYERNLLSWKTLNKYGYVYPRTIKKFLLNERDLFDLFWNNSKNDKGHVTLDGFYDMFAYFISDKTEFLPPQFLGEFRKFDPKKENSRSYLSHVSEVLSSIDDFQGLDMGNFLKEKLPMSISSKFDELIPKECSDSSFNSGVVSKPKRSLYFIRNRMQTKFQQFKELDDSALDLANNQDHFLVYLERRIKESKGISDDSFVIFQNLEKERTASTELYDELIVKGRKNYDFIRNLIRWFLRENKKLDISDKSVVTRHLIKSLSRYSDVFLKEKNPDGSYSSIFEDMNKLYSGTSGCDELCSKYGFIMVYNFLLVKFGEKVAESDYGGMLLSLEMADPVSRKSRLEQIVKETFSRSNEAFLFFESNPLYKRFSDLMDVGGVRGRKFSSGSIDLEQEAFWRRVRNEHDKYQKKIDA